ncbi:DUF1460 domain-containing protein [Myxococcota bacterium]|nr:DUF1460 domain-containing protein [Myxococcota bacterium]
MSARATRWRWGPLLAAWLLVLGPAAAASLDEDTGEGADPVVVDEGAMPEELVAVAREVAARPVGERMAAISQVLLGRPYRVDAAGEGRAPDRDPPARYDAFDCLTFVEEVLALALAGDPLSAPALRQRLRYGDAAPTYEARRHFMISQWVPGAVADGLLADITDQLGETHLVDLAVTPATWRGWRRRALFALPDDRLPVGRFTLPVLSVDAALAAIDDIPPGALVLTVRQPRPGVPMVVTHLGFKLPGGGDRPMIRHATKMSGQRVMDHGLAWYLEHLRWYDRWPVDGVTVLVPREQGPRRTALPPG